MKTVSNEELIKAEHNLLDLYRESTNGCDSLIESYEKVLEDYSSNPEIILDSVFLGIDKYGLDVDYENGLYIVDDNDGNVIAAIDFASSVYKWVARFGSVN